MIHAKHQCIPLVVHEKKIYEVISKFAYFAPFWHPKGATPFI